MPSIWPPEQANCLLLQWSIVKADLKFSKLRFTIKNDPSNTRGMNKNLH